MNAEKNIYLTFDDGPTPEVTLRVLALLKEYNAKATFFCLGKNVEKFPEIYNEILIQGHAVGNHSYSHFNGWKTSNKKYIQDVNKASLRINSKIFRPPYGKISPLQCIILKKTFRIVLWTCLSKDYSQKMNEEKILNRIKRATKNDAIIVFHDSAKTLKKLLNILPEYLKFLNTENYVCALIK
ncbi:MAG: polysaccharide deacetylase family protein [Bacteroidetes bacterium CG_4_8_14_3_um_filter_31_14]|nr:MAG: polysaccharide deacetylase family protein [Bacteroidetes bacterium CG_4_8_14_3_um_filter_31_14]